MEVLRKLPTTIQIPRPGQNPGGITSRMNWSEMLNYPRTCIACLLCDLEVSFSLFPPQILRYVPIVLLTLFVIWWTLGPIFISIPAINFSLWLPTLLIVAITILGFGFCIDSPIADSMGLSYLIFGLTLFQIVKRQCYSGESFGPDMSPQQCSPEAENEEKVISRKGEPRPIPLLKSGYQTKGTGLCTNGEHFLRCSHKLSTNEVAYSDICSRKCKKPTSIDLRDPPPLCAQCRPPKCGRFGHLLTCGHFISGHYLGEQWFKGLIHRSESSQIACILNCVKPLKAPRLDVDPACPVCDKWDKEDQLLEALRKDLLHAYDKWNAADLDNDHEASFSRSTLLKHILERERIARNAVGWEVWREYQAKGPALFSEYVTRRNTILKSKGDHGITRAVAKPRDKQRICPKEIPRKDDASVSTLDRSLKRKVSSESMIELRNWKSTDMMKNGIQLLPGSQLTTPQHKINAKSLAYMLELGRHATCKDICTERAKLIGTNETVFDRIETAQPVVSVIHFNACAHRLVRYAAFSTHSLSTIRDFSIGLKRPLLKFDGAELAKLEMRLPKDPISIRERLFILMGTDGLIFSPILKVPWQRWLDFTHNVLSLNQLQAMEADVWENDFPLGSQGFKSSYRQPIRPGLTAPLTAIQEAQAKWYAY